MLHITKSEPAIFTHYLSKTQPRRWEDVDGYVSRTWREYLIKVEQNGVSAYTELPLSLDKSHIDHFFKRDFNAKVFDWDNLFADSLDETFGAKYKDKQKNLDYRLLINPAVDNAAAYFEYSPNGKILPSHGLSENATERADYTISIFNLNAPALVERRRQMFNQICVTASGIIDANILRIAFRDYGFPSVLEQIIDDLKSPAPNR